MRKHASAFTPGHLGEVKDENRDAQATYIQGAAGQGQAAWMMLWVPLPPPPPHLPAGVIGRHGEMYCASCKIKSRSPLVEELPSGFLPWFCPVSPPRPPLHCDKGMQRNAQPFSLDFANGVTWNMARGPDHSSLWMAQESINGNDTLYPAPAFIRESNQ